MKSKRLLHWLAFIILIASASEVGARAQHNHRRNSVSWRSPLQQFAATPFELETSKQVVAPKADSKAVRMMSFNILAPIWLNPAEWDHDLVPFLDNSDRFERVCATLERLNADVITLQEVTQSVRDDLKWRLKEKYITLPLAAHRNQYWGNYLAPGYSYVDNGNVILFRKSRFMKIFSKDVPVSPDGNTAGMSLIFDKVTHRNILVIAAHLDAELPSETRIEQTENLIKAITSVEDTHFKPIVILGADMNDGHHADLPLHRNLRHHKLKSIWTACSDREYCTHPFDEGGEPMVIDHIYVSHSVTIQNAHAVDEIPEAIHGNDRVAQALQRYGSDHFPIMADLTL